MLQVAAAVTLLALAGLVLQTFLNLFPSSPGFATESRSAFIWHLNERQYADASDRRRRVKEWMEQLKALLLTLNIEGAHHARAEVVSGAYLSRPDARDE